MEDRPMDDKKGRGREKQSNTLHLIAAILDTEAAD